MSKQDKKITDSSPSEQEVLLLISEMIKKIEYLDSSKSLESINSVKGECYRGHLIELNEQSYEYLCEITIHCPGSPPEIISIEPAPKEYALRLAKTYVDGRVAARRNEFSQILETFEELSGIEDKKEEVKNESVKLREKRHLLLLEIKKFKKEPQNIVRSNIFAAIVLMLIPNLIVSLIQNRYGHQLFSIGFVIAFCSGTISLFLHLVIAMRPLNNYVKRLEMME